MNMLFIWVIILISTIVVEAISLNLTSIWFGLGALFALILASFGLPVSVQLLVFVFVSALCLVFVRPFTRKFLQTKGEKTNSDRIIGQNALVVEQINESLSQGQIKLMGQVWTARSIDPAEIIKVGDEVRVLSIAGVKAIVEKQKTHK